MAAGAEPDGEQDWNSHAPAHLVSVSTSSLIQAYSHDYSQQDSTSSITPAIHNKSAMSVCWEQWFQDHRVNYPWRKEKILPQTLFRVIYH